MFETGICRRHNLGASTRVSLIFDSLENRTEPRFTTRDRAEMNDTSRYRGVIFLDIDRIVDSRTPLSNCSRDLARG